MRIDYIKGGNIIGLVPRPVETVFPAVNVIDAYWSALAAQSGPDKVPLRSQIDPRGIGTSLANAFILEQVAPGIARFRLAGSHLADLMGMEVRGMPLTAMFLPEARDTVARVLDAAFSTPACATLVLTGQHGLGRAPLEARMTLLPLRDEEGRVSRVLGGIEAKGVIGRQPRRFTITQQRTTSLARCSTTRTGIAERQMSGLADPATTFVAAPQGERPGLRLVHLKAD